MPIFFFYLIRFKPNLGLAFLVLVFTSIKFMLVTSSNGKNYEYDKYISNKHYKVPTLESLFQVVTFRDNMNTSSPCLHQGKRRLTECHKVVSFDRAGYEKSLQDTRNLILSRLNLNHEPEVKLSKSKMSFIDQLESRLINDAASNQFQSSSASSYSNQHSMQKTKYDMKTPETNKIFNSMHEASSFTQDCAAGLPYVLDEQGRNSLCISFEVPSKIFLNPSSIGSQKPLKHKRIQSVLLWIYIKSSEQVPDSEETGSAEDSFNMRIENLHTRTALNYRNLVDGWNTIDLKNLVDVKSEQLMASAQVNVTLALKCMNLECTIGYTDKEPISSNVERILHSEYETSENDEESEERVVDYHLLINNRPGKKPLLSINIYENEEVADSVSIGKAKNRGKRKTNSHNNHNIHSGNYRVNGIEKETYAPKLCYNNYPDANRECCLITYFVNFNSLKWSSWILSPSGFVANYCSGKCNDIKSKFFQVL